MTGVEIACALLRADAAILARMPAEQIKAGALPDDAPLPSMFVRSISEVERSKLKREGRVRFVDRVEVVVRAASFRDARDLRILAREACVGRVGDIAGATGVSISNAGAGPELNGPNRSFQRGQDLRISYETPV